MTDCKLTVNGYCLRSENDYCPDGECNCPHWLKKTKVIGSVATCETTIMACIECGEYLSEPKIEC